MAVGLLRLYEATGKRDYLVMAALAASWLFGNNVLERPLYDPATGRCFDGIRDSLTINTNSGGESTIEALLTLVEIERFPGARDFLLYRKAYSGERGEYRTADFRNTAGETITLRIDRRDGTLSILEGDAGTRFRERNR
jgi:hypothetical protein